jgi:hypothetical protein
MDDHMHHAVDIYTEPFHQQAFDSLGHSPDAVADSQTFVDYPTSTDALSGSLANIAYPISTMEFRQENIGAVDFAGVTSTFIVSRTLSRSHTMKLRPT